MNHLFERASSYWVCFDRYELKEGNDGIVYVTPAEGAIPKVYDPLKAPEEMVLAALNVGMLCMGRKSEEVIRDAVMEFVSSYGLLGLMTALPTTPHFMDYKAVYLPKNRFLSEESMDTMEYLNIFFPFDKPVVGKRGIESIWNVSEDKHMMALAMTFSKQPMAMNMSFQREYAERYDWLVAQFKDWAFTLVSSYLYYLDYDKLSENDRNAYRMGMAAFGGIAPTYHIALLDKATIVWDFNSMLQAIQLMFSFLLTDGDRPLKLCKFCQKAFIADKKDAEFCSPKCKRQYDSYRKKKK